MLQTCRNPDLIHKAKNADIYFPGTPPLNAAHNLQTRSGLHTTYDYFLKQSIAGLARLLPFVKLGVSESSSHAKGVTKGFVRFMSLFERRPKIMKWRLPDFCFLKQSTVPR